MLAVLILFFALYMGVFNKLQVTEALFPGGYFIYYDYQGHINSVARFHETLQKSLSIPTAHLPRLTLTYDDPFNLKDPRAFRASLGFFFAELPEAKLLDEFKKLHYEWRALPQAKALYGEFPYRNASSMAFGATRFLPACLTYILRNKKIKDICSAKAGTVELISDGRIKYYMVLEKQECFYLTTKEQGDVKNEDKYTNLYYKKNL